MNIVNYFRKLFEPRYRIIEYTYANGSQKYHAQYRRFLKWRHCEDGAPVYGSSVEAQGAINKMIDDRNAAIEKKRGEKLVSTKIFHMNTKL